MKKRGGGVKALCTCLVLRLLLVHSQGLCSEVIWKQLYGLQIIVSCQAVNPCTIIQ